MFVGGIFVPHFVRELKWWPEIPPTITPAEGTPTLLQRKSQRKRKWSGVQFDA
jgi:hypothetical protein